MVGGLFKYRRIGHDLAVSQADYVPILLKIEVCVAPHVARATLKAQLLARFGNRRLADGQSGFFHPDNFTFGQGVAISRLIGTGMAASGVQTLRVLQLIRAEHKGLPGVPDVPADGLLPMGANEIAQLDNDPDFPENGKLELILRGGI